MIVRILAIFVILPVLGAVIGYTTKWVSVHLLFWPRRWIGIGPFGWQGVVQRRSPKFATGIAEMLVAVVPVAEVVGRIDVERFVEILADSLRRRLDAAAPAVVGALSPGTWDAMAPQAQEMVTTLIGAETNAALAEIAEAMIPALEEVDISPLIVEMLSGRTLTGSPIWCSGSRHTNCGPSSDTAQSSASLSVSSRRFSSWCSNDGGCCR